MVEKEHPTEERTTEGSGGTVGGRQWRERGGGGIYGGVQLGEGGRTCPDGVRGGVTGGGVHVAGGGPDPQGGKRTTVVLASWN